MSVCVCVISQKLRVSSFITSHLKNNFHYYNLATLCTCALEHKTNTYPIIWKVTLPREIDWAICHVIKGMPFKHDYSCFHLPHIINFPNCNSYSHEYVLRAKCWWPANNIE